MENFDDLMRKQYESDDPASRFQFREEYWEQALAMIEAEEQRRKKRRRRWWMWCCFALLCTGILAGSIRWHARRTPETPAPHDAIRQHAMPPPNDHQKLTLDTAKTTSNSLQSISAGIPDTTLDRTARAVNTKTNRQKPKAAGDQFAGGLAPQTSAGNPADATPTLQASGGGADISPAPQTAQVDVTEWREEMTAFEVLVLPFPTVAAEWSAPANLPLPAETQVTTIRQDRKWQLRAGGFGTVYQAAPDKRRAGFSVQTQLSYRLGSAWQATAGIGLRFQPGAWTDSLGTGQTTQFKYGFGFERTVSERRQSGLLYVEMPLGIQWQWRRFQVEAGLAPGVLIMALDRFKQSKEDSFKALRVTRNRLERADRSPFQSFYANPYAACAWQLDGRLSLAARGVWRPTKIVKATPDAPARFDGSHLELGLYWAF